MKDIIKIILQQLIYLLAGVGIAYIYINVF